MLGSLGEGLARGGQRVVARIGWLSLGIAGFGPKGGAAGFRVLLHLLM